MSIPTPPQIRVQKLFDRLSRLEYLRKKAWGHAVPKKSGYCQVGYAIRRWRAREIEDRIRETEYELEKWLGHQLYITP